MHINLSDQYRHGRSLVHRLDPRVKVVATFCFILATSLMPAGAFPMYPLLLALSLVAIVISEVGLAYILKRALIALPFALAALPLVVSVPGPALAQWGALRISAEGTTRLLSIMFKSWLSLQVSLVLVSTTTFPDLLWALRSLRLPRVLVAIAGFMYRYLFVLADEASRLLRARAARSGMSSAGGAGGGLVWRAKVAGGMVGNLFLRSYERSERVYDAMASRGYAGELRTLAAPRLRLLDVLIGLGLLIPLSVLLAFSLLVY